MTNQAHLSTALHLGDSPTMLFSGELHGYVQFVAMLRNTFDKTINDPFDKTINDHLIHYKINIECFAGELVRDIIARRLSIKMCAEFTYHIRAKGLIDKTAEYLPRLLEWAGGKIVF